MDGDSRNVNTLGAEIDPILATRCRHERHSRRHRVVFGRNDFDCVVVAARDHGWAVAPGQAPSLYHQAGGPGRCRPLTDSASTVTGQDWKSLGVRRAYAIAGHRSRASYPAHPTPNKRGYLPRHTSCQRIPRPCLAAPRSVRPGCGRSTQIRWPAPSPRPPRPRASQTGLCALPGTACRRSVGKDG